MNKTLFQRTVHLQIGSYYFLHLHPDDHGLPVFTRVKYLGSTDNPAILLVQDDRQYLIDCSPLDLYLDPSL